jgi:electron transfer flavoprotein beta subunit
MNFIACVKRVPATDTQVRVGKEGRAIDPACVSNYVMNPYDEFGVEECLRQKEKHGGTVTVLTLGSPDAKKELTGCLALGADDAVLLKDAATQRDPLSTAKILAAQLKTMTFDVVFFGKQAVDHDNAQVGAIVGTLLDLPTVTEVVKLEIEAGKATVHREFEGKTEVWEVTLPCVLTAQKGLNEPRYASMKGIMAAKKKVIKELDAAADAGQVEVTAMEPPPPRPAGKLVGDGAAAVPELIRLLREEAKVL